MVGDFGGEEALLLSFLFFSVGRLKVSEDADGGGGDTGDGLDAGGNGDAGV